MSDTALLEPSISSTPSYGRGWFIICSALFFQAFTLGIFVYCFTFWILPWSEEFDASRAEIMLAMMAGNIFISFISPFAGKALDKKPVQYVVALGLVVYACGLALISMATALWQIIGIYSLLLSFGVSFSGPMAGQWLAIRWMYNRRGVALGLVSVGSSVGGFLFPPLVTFLQTEFGWRTTHMILAFTAVAVFLPYTLAFIRAPQVQLSLATQSAPPPMLSTQQVLSSSKFWLIIIALLPLVISVIVFTANLAPYTAELGIGLQEASYTMSIFAAGMIAGKIGSGIFIDKMDFRRVYFILIGLLITGQVLLSMYPGSPLLFLGAILVGFSAGSFLTMSASIVGNLYPQESFGSVLGLVHLANVWTAAAIPLSGLARQFLGSYTPIWLSLTLFTAVAALAMLKLQPQR